MSEKSVCSNCGKSMKDNWLVCKYCHQARWKMIRPYFVWGIIFFLFSWWAFTQKIFPISRSENIVTLLLPIFGVTFGIISIVMLLMAIIASLRGLTVRKIIAENMPEKQIDWNVSTIEPALVEGQSDTSELENKHQEIDQLNRSLEVNLKEPSIFCQKCNHQNQPDSKKCSQCGADLLPGAGFAERLGVFILTTILALVSFGCGFLFFRFKPEFNGKDWIYLAGIILFGVFMFGLGVLSAFRKVPIHERYSTRAKRHISLIPRQAISDFSSAINSAPLMQAFDYLQERANLFQNLGMEEEAKLDWKLALKNINSRMANLKPPFMELTKQRAEIYKNLDMQDEYAMEMLLYTIEKESAFKFKEDEIAKGLDEGFKKGTEDVKRKEFHQQRTDIMKNPRYGIVGYCHKCKSAVDLDYKLKCSKDPKHKKITDIKPKLRKPVAS
jgi:hypothetical protein